MVPHAHEAPTRLAGFDHVIDRLRRLRDQRTLVPAVNLLKADVAYDGPRQVDVDAALELSPSRPATGDVGSILLVRDERLFLGIGPRRRRNRLIKELSA